MYYHEISVGDEFIYVTNENLKQLEWYVRPRQEQMYGKKYIKHCRKYAYGFNEDGTINLRFLNAPEGMVVVEPTNKHYDLVLEEVLQTLDKPLDEYDYYMESQTGKRSERNCDFRTRAEWGHGVFAEDPTTGEKFCLRSDYDSSG